MHEILLQIARLMVTTIPYFFSADPTIIGGGLAFTHGGDIYLAENIGVWQLTLTDGHERELSWNPNTKTLSWVTEITESGTTTPIICVNWQERNYEGLCWPTPDMDPINIRVSDEYTLNFVDRKTDIEYLVVLDRDTIDWFLSRRSNIETWNSY